MGKKEKIVTKPKFYKAPTGEFTDEQIKVVQMLAGIGLSVPKIASYFGLSKSTFERRCDQQPQIYDALLRGRSQSEAKVARTAYDMAISGKHPEMTKFWLRCRAGWKDGLTAEFTDPREQPQGAIGADHAVLAQLVNMSTDDLKEHAKILEMELRSSGKYTVRPDEG